MKFYSDYITDLKDDEVFVFTSNTTGFHGAGSAGYASFGEFGNVWRNHDYANKPDGWRGKWNVKGCPSGLQYGRDGKSYAIISVKKPGCKRSITKGHLKATIEDFYKFADENPQYKFYVAQDAKPGYNGYTVEEMVEMWSVKQPPGNVYFYEPFYTLLKEYFPLSIFDE